jgi:hypothetical protein
MMVAGELGRVCEDKRLSYHYFNMMMPAAARAVQYAQRAASCSQSGSIDRAQFTVNHLLITPPRMKVPTELDFHATEGTYRARCTRG